MRQRVLNDKYINDIMEKIAECDKKDEVCAYIGEVAERCAELCRAGEHLRAIYEIKFLLNNLQKKLGL